MNAKKHHLLAAISSYYHTHPHDTTASSFFQAIQHIDDEQTISLLRQRMKKALRHLWVTRMAHKQEHIRQQYHTNEQLEQAQADELLAQLEN